MEEITSMLLQSNIVGLQYVQRNISQFLGLGPQYTQKTYITFEEIQTGTV